MIDVALWIVVGLGAVTASSHLSEAARLAALHAMSPWVMGPSLPVSVVALATRRWVLAAVAVGVLMVLVALAPPLRRRSIPQPAGTPLTVLYANVKFDQPTPHLAAHTLFDLVVAYDVDVLALSEVTVTLADALDGCGIADLFPHRVGEPVVGPEASVIWTRRRVLDCGDPGPGPTWDADVTVDLDGDPVRLIATHPLPPIGADMRPHWKPGLASTATRARKPGPPVLVVGDLNAARWHRPWRRFVGREFTSAHEAVGRGWSASWPADRRIPPFVRLDHALCGSGLFAVAVEDVEIFGSDHRGFVVTVAAKVRTARPR